MAKSREKLKARKLRRLGRSIKEIAETLKISIGSVSAWCKDIELTQNQIINLQKRRTDPFYGKKLDYFLRKKKEFEEKVFNLKQEGIREIKKLTKREIFLIGVALYWAEGFKKDHQVGFANIDVNMIKFFLYWLKVSFNISNTDLIFRLTANESYKEKIRDLEKFWSSELNVPLSQFSKPFFQKTLWKKRYERPNSYHGVLRVKVKKSVNLLRKIYGYIEGISLNLN
ncbi:hypothetical protein A3I50_04400 [Candidatus Roizmanbacteria bacterium RIFCSPLOWO2_02_FULL_37_9]|uniref:Uncharacterized protein n=1 Tax=Candidatus Roizmanbacteria bacterium RIFCSPLOWO2_01_FULL_37_16 TaxID=1802058 RepID=A0A1F7IMF4_9BACT|nr:MAG: hypothetical protein A3F57_02850 [Candidatus Roizmanbacteria bacterium RIFCSPHIGHO2_12_FULL_36_11]OGK44480.1 MAG: hypothetical protein A3B40_01685 [Candidatus Roizmanbacteria bacterium RIFCSPLOWO2_01_FULL_37_16]OGK55944.1 MAG: hypothetical protein A3I50_04400 [Candidatus Roizmanbacteria bacterium RIFCSPLOWO2_02_FULL_37_9]